MTKTTAARTQLQNLIQELADLEASLPPDAISPVAVAAVSSMVNVVLRRLAKTAMAAEAVVK